MSNLESAQIIVEAGVEEPSVEEETDLVFGSAGVGHGNEETWSG